MATASTMAFLIETLRLNLPMSATAPATHVDRGRIAEASGISPGSRVSLLSTHSQFLTWSCMPPVRPNVRRGGAWTVTRRPRLQQDLRAFAE
jgi:hypothetical protein